MPQNPLDHPSPLLVVVTSLPSLDAAKSLARSLVEQNLAACVQLTDGMQSIYRWEGKVCEEQEVLLSAKTAGSKWPEICAFIQGAHPYDLPEILAFTPAQYEEQYSKWVRSGVNSKI
jgi:periplasmic divalent cation tolerance protein